MPNLASRYQSGTWKAESDSSVGLNGPSATPKPGGATIGVGAGGKVARGRAAGGGGSGLAEGFGQAQGGAGAGEKFERRFCGYIFMAFLRVYSDFHKALSEYL